MKDSFCFSVVCWVFQILVWAMLIYMIVAIVAGLNLIGPCTAFGICYLTYIILEFCSSVAKYLCNKTSEGGIYQKMGSYYRSYPVFQFYCECYHYEKRTRRVKRKVNGKIRYRTETRTVKVTTHRESYDFPYYSERDVSGLFYLDCDRAFITRRRFIQLDILTEINFADPISCMDYEIAKDNFWRRNRFRDVRFYFNESRYIPGLVRENLVTLGNSGPCCVNFFFYFMFTLITFAELYKCCYNSMCIDQTYRIRKLVSTRYDLNQPVYVDFIPHIDLITQQYNYDICDYNYLNNDFKVKLPTKDELERANKYKHKVPDYKISSGGGKIHAGVVLDDPGYSSYDLNKPPEAFTSIAGDVALKKNQINANGAPPPGFGQNDFKFNVRQNEDDSDSDDDNNPPNQQNQGFGSNTLNVNKNPTNTNIPNNQSRDINTYTERNPLKNNVQNAQQITNQNSKHFPDDNQYPPQQQQYPPQQQQYPPQQQQYSPQHFPVDDYSQQQNPPQHFPVEGYPPQQYPQQYPPQQYQPQIYPSNY